MSRGWGCRRPVARAGTLLWTLLFVFLVPVFVLPAFLLGGMLTIGLWCRPTYWRLLFWWQAWREPS